MFFKVCFINFKAVEWPVGLKAVLYVTIIFLCSTSCKGVTIPAARSWLLHESRCLKVQRSWCSLQRFEFQRLSQIPGGGLIRGKKDR